MAVGDIANTKFFSLVRVPGTQPSNPGSFEEPQPVVNPPGTGAITTFPPVRKRYTSLALMQADQANQFPGYLYFDGTNTWWYKGGGTGVIGDYEPFFSGDNPTNVSYLNLIDTDDSDYADKSDFVPHVNETETGLILKRINKNVDGGFANSVYLTVQQIDGGGA